MKLGSALPSEMKKRRLLLVSGDLGSRDNVALEIGLVDVGSVAGIGRLDVARNLNGGGWVSAASSSDLDLSAGNIKLGWAAGVVDAELLDAKQVLSGGELRGNGNGVGGCERIKHSSYE